MDEKLLDHVREYLVRKEKLLLRNKEFQREAAEFDAAAPSLEELSNWPPPKQLEFSRKCSSFAARWGCLYVDHRSLTREPFGGGKTWPMYVSLVQMSPPQSRLLVVGIDVSYDLDRIWGELKELITGHKRFWKKYGKDLAEKGSGIEWGEHRLGEEELAILDEVIEIWDMVESGKTTRQIADEKYPGKPPRVGLLTVRRRLKQGQELIEEKGYMKLVPFTSGDASMSWLRQYLQTKGVDRG
jgi:hypothetical protein